MFSKTILLLTVLAAAATGQSNKNCSTSEVSGMNTCWMDYFTNYAFTSIPLYKDYRAKYESFFQQQGPAFMPKLCSWIKAKNDCEQPFLADCHDQSSYKKVFGTDAGDYFSTEAVNLWECGEGYNLTLDHFWCKHQVTTLHYNELEACKDKVISEFNHGFSCVYANEYVKCVQEVYLRYCGSAAEKFGCDYASVIMKVDVPQCNTTLPMC